MDKKKVLVLGLGKTGISVLKKVHKLSDEIIGFDNNPDYDITKECKYLRNIKNISIYTGDKADEVINRLNKVDLIITSPGVSGDNDIILSAKERKIPVISELEFSWQLMSEKQRKNTIAVTGTNGKTTVVSLINYLLNQCGKQAIACGNIGNPLLDTLEFEINEISNTKGYVKNDEIIRVIEVSSFQLENIIDFSPFLAVLLNITEDHIDRHKSMDDYAKIKFKIFKNQSSEAYSILNLDDEYTNKFLKKPEIIGNFKSKLIFYSLHKKEKSNLYYEGKSIFYDFYGKNGDINILNRKLVGKHNILNILAAFTAAKIFGLKDDEISKSIINFNPLEHRLEYVGEINGIRCFNDSKATNPDATLKALENFNKEVTIILGGLDKEVDFSCLTPALNKKVKNVILIGSCKDKLSDLFSKKKQNFKVFKADSLEMAVEIGLKVSKRGEVFLLSPACASMDMFKDYKDRGEKFKKLLLKSN